MTDNPYDRSIALHYDLQGAPTVLATGQGEIARLIRERAEEAGVPIVEDPKLATLLSNIPLGDEIPPDLLLFFARRTLGVDHPEHDVGLFATLLGHLDHALAE